MLKAFVVLTDPESTVCSKESGIQEGKGKNLPKSFQYLGFFMKFHCTVQDQAHEYLKTEWLCFK